MTEVVGEISGNHGGNLNNALRLITEAKAAGADAVKFQTFQPARLADKRAKNPEIVKLAQDLHGETSLYNLYLKTHTPWAWFPHLIKHANDENIPWFSSVFDPADVVFLETLDCPRYKISAFEMLDGFLINAVVLTGKRIVMSVRPMPGLTILRATHYEAGKEEMFGVSDHLMIGSKAWLSTCPMVERHIRLPDVETPDSAFSSTPEEFRQYVATIRAGTAK